MPYHSPAVYRGLHSVELATLRATERLPKVRPGNTEFAREGILRPSIRWPA
jgi:hypothetical protein